MITRKIFLLLLTSSLILVMSACSVPTIVAPTPTSSQPTVAPTALETATPILPSPTSAPTMEPTAVQPTEMPTTQPTATQPAPTAIEASPTEVIPGTGGTAAPPQRISFASGATAATVSGDLPANGADRYILRVMAGQLIEVNLSPREGLSLAVHGEDGTMIKRKTSDGAFFRGVVPSTQDYILTITSGNQPVSYSMSVIIPARISFARGETSAILEGRVGASRSQYYVIHVTADQLLDVTVTPEEGLQLVVYGADGNVLKSGMSEGASFRGIVPSTQDYILVINAANPPVNFSMNVFIPVRISFAPGATSATVQGKLAAHESQYYILRALKDQTMDINTTPDSGVQLIVYGVDGNVLKSGMGEGADFHGPLPSTQDYILIIRAAGQAVNYSMKVTIQ